MLQFDTSLWKEELQVLPSILTNRISGVVLYEALDISINKKFIAGVEELRPHFYNDLNQSNGYSLPGMFGQLHKTQPAEVVQKYFEGIEPFCSKCNEVCGFDVAEFITTIFEGAFQPYAAETLPGFLPYSFRVVFAGKGGLFLHRDRELLAHIYDEPSQRIQHLVQPDTMMSWFFTLQQPQAGGELWVADSRYTELQKAGAVQLKQPDGTIIEDENELQHLLIKTPERSLLMFVDDVLR